MFPFAFSEISMGQGTRMGMPSGWHRRQALMLASQLPENLADAQLVMQAVTELLDTFLAKAPLEESRPSNVLPFGNAS